MFLVLSGENCSHPPNFPVDKDSLKKIIGAGDLLKISPIIFNLNATIS